MNNRHSPSRWLTELAALIDAGLALDSALKSITKGMNTRSATPFLRVAGAVKKGSTLAKAGLSAGILDEFSARVIEAGEHSGHLSRVLRRLAAREELRIKLKRQFRSRMIMPLSVVVIAIFVTPLPKLAEGSLSGPDYLISTAGLLMVTVIVWRLLLGLIRWARENRTASTALDRVEITVPVLSNVRLRQSNTDFLDSLSLTYSAGIPLYEAFELSVASIRNSTVRSAFQLAAHELHTGKTLSDAISGIEFIDNSTLSMIRTGELSGQLDDTLERLVTSERQKLEGDQRFIGEWLPRIFYFGVAAWVISKLTGIG